MLQPCTLGEGGIEICRLGTTDGRTMALVVDRATIETINTPRDVFEKWDGIRDIVGPRRLVITFKSGEDAEWREVKP